jgi:cyclase
MKMISTLTLLSALFFSIPALSQEQAEFQETRLADGLYVIQGVGGFTGGNIALSIGEDGVIMIDDSMPPFYDKLNAKISELAGKPVDLLINTHVHGDHIGNNAAFADTGTHIIAHKNLRQHLLERGIQGPDGMIEAPKGALPVITFSEEMALHLNGQTATLSHLHHAHTNGDTLIHFSDLNIIHTGDALFNGMFPFIDLNSGGSVEGYIKAQQHIYGLADDDTQIIPGHGPLANKADLKASIEMLIDSRDKVQALLNKGMNEEEIVKANPLEPYHDKWNWGFITTERMTRTLVQGLSKQAATELTHSH